MPAFLEESGLISAIASSTRFSLGRGTASYSILVQKRRSYLGMWYEPYWDHNHRAIETHI
jgi:hypothetical protein